MAEVLRKFLPESLPFLPVVQGLRMKPRLKAAHVSPQRAVHGTHLRGLGYGEQGAAWLPEMLLESLPELPGIWFLIWRCIACA